MARGRGKQTDQGGCGLLLVIGIVVALVRCGGGTEPSFNTTSDSTSTPPTFADNAYRYVEAERLNCRNEPAAKAKRIARLAHGDFVTVEDTKNGWSRVRASGSSCWVASSSLTEKAPVAAPAPLPAYRPDAGSKTSGRSGSGSGSGGKVRSGRRQSLREGPSFQCGGKSVCGQMDSCEEANFYLNQCGMGRLDRDNDGVPCESICG
jgi:hypothetical protein